MRSISGKMHIRSRGGQKNASFVSTLLALSFAAGAAAQEPTLNLGCDDGWGGSGGREEFCEIRELTVPVTDTLTVDAAPNGGVRVTRN